MEGKLATVWHVLFGMTAYGESKTMEAGRSVA